jgi:hypothetical protein
MVEIAGRVALEQEVVVDERFGHFRFGFSMLDWAGSNFSG